MNQKIRSVTLLIVSFLYTSICTAQHNNSFAGIRFGGALPMGEFASHEFGTGGYALLGKSFGGEAAWFINPKIGFGVDFSMNTFNFASGFYAEDYQEHEPAFTRIELLSSPYKLYTIMAGAYYKMPILPGFNTTFKLMGGMMQAQTPDQLYNIEAFLTGKLTFWKTSSLDRNYALLTGASLEYQLYDKVTLLLQADFTYSEMAFIYLRGNSSYVDYLQMPVFRLQPGINIRF